MRHTRIVTVFVQNDDRLLILKRSKRVKTMKGLWAAVSGVIEGDEEPLSRAKIEVFEEIGLAEDKITTIKTTRQMKVNSPQYENHEWEIFPFLFGVKNPQIKLNWENSEYRWIKRNELGDYRTVPSLDSVLFNLL